MKSGGGGTPQAPQDPTPNIHNVADANGITPYGQATQFNPMYDSILPTGGGPAMLGDQVRQEGGGNVPLQAQQAAQVAAQQAAAQQAAQNPQQGGGLSNAQRVQNLLNVTGSTFGGPNTSRGDRDFLTAVMAKRFPEGARH